MTLISPSDASVAAVYTILTSRHADFSSDEISELQSAFAAPETVMASLETLVQEGKAARLPNQRYLSDQAATRLRETARRLTAAYHKQNPLRYAMPRENLEMPLQKAAQFQDFDAVRDWLVGQGILVSEGARGVRLPSHEMIMPAGWQKASEEILAVYQAAGLQPPFPGNFQANYPRDVSVIGILLALTEQGKLIDLGNRLYISVETLEKTTAILRRLADASEEVTVGSLRDATESSRKVIVPLLEYLDAQGVTRRVGDTHVLV